MKLLLFSLVVAFAATRTALGGGGGTAGGHGEEVQYECHEHKGKGKSLKGPIIVEDIETYDKCVEACIVWKKKINRVDGVSWGIKTHKCQCLKDMTRILTAKGFQENYRSCHLKRDEPNEINGVPGHEVVASEAVDLSYNYFKNLNCDETWTRIGCYNVTEADRFLLNYKCDVEWEPKRHPHFARSLVCACAEAARLNDVRYFATHFWGECWEIDPEAIGSKSPDGCRLADGTYNNHCDSIDHGGDCLGVTGYYIYTNVGTASEEDKKKKRELNKKDIAKRDSTD